ncbi:uncharacterized protein LOC128364991 [Scomber scombrus]|uniref:Uncharacterized protein LOC128364991 n=1 Tax=Scomber scombrus TaxID=13677 RepID=A0AAV1NJR6_SCOSC
MADASFKKEFLETHNAYRAQHSTKPLTYNGELNAAAQKWADHLLSISSLGHSDTKDGENVYNMWSSTPLNLTGKEAVDSWYSEIKDYNWGNPGFNGNTGHFTQVVWAESTELGVGLATDGNKVFVVGQYRPAGNMNMPGYFEKNVQTKGNILDTRNQVLHNLLSAQQNKYIDSAAILMYHHFGEHTSSSSIYNVFFSTDASFKKEFLETHNAYRAQHGAKPLTYNDGLNAAAQKWADHLLSISSMGHSDTKDGENVYNMWSSAPLNLTGKEAVDSWYSEIKDYNWGSPGFNGNTGHFTQVVWAGSTELGVGLATDGNKVFVVGQYRPAGNMNMPGYFAKNVQTKDAKQFPPGREVDGADNTAMEQAQ